MEQRSRSPAFLDAMPDRRDDDGRQQGAGSLVPFSGVRCPTPHCRNKLAEELHGTATFWCRKCRQTVTVTRE